MRFEKKNMCISVVNQEEKRIRYFIVRIFKVKLHAKKRRSKKEEKGEVM